MPRCTGAIRLIRVLMVTWLLLISPGSLHSIQNLGRLQRDNWEATLYTARSIQVLISCDDLRIDRGSEKLSMACVSIAPELQPPKPQLHANEHPKTKVKVVYDAPEHAIQLLPLSLGIDGL